MCCFLKIRVNWEYPNLNYRVPEIAGSAFSRLISGNNFHYPNFKLPDPKKQVTRMPRLSPFYSTKTKLNDLMNAPRRRPGTTAPATRTLSDRLVHVHPELFFLPPAMGWSTDLGYGRTSPPILS